MFYFVTFWLLLVFFFYLTENIPQRFNELTTDTFTAHSDIFIGK